jgi:hypothetical protein
MAAKKRSVKTRRAPAAALAVRLVGPGVRSGRIRVPDLLGICQHAQAAVNRQAEALEGRAHTQHRGPASGKVQEECTLELVGLGRGSVVLCFEQAKSQPNLPAFEQFSNLGEAAITSVGRALKALADGKGGDIDPGVLQSLSDLGDVLDDHVKKIEWRVPGRHGRRAINVAIDKKIHARIARQLQPAPTSPLSVEGVLEMIDFKPGDFRCRIHPPVGASIPCTFSTAVEDDVFANLRRPVRVDGLATINPQTQRTETLAIKAVTPLDALSLNAESFFAGASFEQHARQQGVEPVRDPKTMAGLWREDEDVDAIVADIYRRRA